MRLALLGITLALLAPIAAGASQVHVTYVDDTYAVTFASSADSVTVETDAGRVSADRVGGGALFRAILPPNATRYTLEGRAFELQSPASAMASSASASGPTRIAFVGDLGVSSEARAIVAAIAREKPDLVLLGGDLSYAHGNDTLWGAWFTMMEPLASRVAIMPAVGNHEVYCEDPARPGDFDFCGLAPNRWSERFPLPGDGRAYAFEWGPMRVTVLDTEAYFAGASDYETNVSEQAGFAAGSLGADDVRWDVVMFHRPLRSTSARDSMQNDVARGDLTPLLDAEADLVLQAHLHAYERSKPGPNGTVYVTSGGGGREIYDDWGPNASWVATRAAEHHFVLLDVNATRIDVRAVRTDGTTLDAFSMTKPAPPEPTPSPSPSPSPPSPSGGWVATPPWANETNASDPDESNGIPAAPLWLALAITLLARRSRQRARE